VRRCRSRPPARAWSVDWTGSTAVRGGTSTTTSRSKCGGLSLLWQRKRGWRDERTLRPVPAVVVLCCVCVRCEGCHVSELPLAGVVDGTLWWPHHALVLGVAAVLLRLLLRCCSAHCVCNTFLRRSVGLKRLWLLSQLQVQHDSLLFARSVEGPTCADTLLLCVV